MPSGTRTPEGIAARRERDRIRNATTCRGCRGPRPANASRCEPCRILRAAEEAVRRVDCREGRLCYVCMRAVAKGRRYCRRHLAYYRERNVDDRARREEAA